MKNGIPLRRRGFSLVELLVVITIISTMMALLLPTLENSLENSKMISCMGSIKQVGFGLGMYLDDYSEWFPPFARGHQSWNILLAKYVGQHITAAGCTKPGIYKDGCYGYNFEYLGDGVYRTTYYSLHHVLRPFETIAFADSYGNVEGWNSQVIRMLYVGRTRTYIQANAAWMQLPAWRHLDGTPIYLLDGHATWIQWDALYSSTKLWDRQ